MKVVAILGIIFCVGFCTVFVAYKAYTDKLIKRQQKEIASLKTQLKRERQREPLEVIKDGRNPSFGGF